ncbi:MAG: hypothetical protein WCB51_13250 [Candidatus Dormiibacterota bacterium]
MTFIDGESSAVLVVSNGAITDAVSVVSGAQESGEAAMARVRCWESALVSCTRLTAEAMSLLDPLLHGELVYSDLRLEWTSWAKLLDDLRARGQTFVVELQTRTQRGVTVIRGGEQVATFSDSQPAHGGADEMDRLAAGGEGSIRVFAHAPGASRASSPSVPTVTPAGSTTTEPVAASTLDRVTTAVSQPGDDESTATFSSLFGIPGLPHPFTPTLLTDRPDPSAPGDLVSLLPELKSLAQRRLQRSSTPVEDAVDRAADENQTLDWLVAFVRGMRVRGFVAETFEHLADEMQALSRTT